MKKKLVITSLIFSLVIIIAAGVIIKGYYDSNERSKEHSLTNEQIRNILENITESHRSENIIRYNNQIIELEKAFKKEPSLAIAGELMIKYLYPPHIELQNYDKALFYAKACIDLGVNKTEVGHTVNYAMALIYKRKNEDSLSLRYLKKAMELNKDLAWKTKCEKDGLLDIYEKIKKEKG